MAKRNKPGFSDFGKSFQDKFARLILSDRNFSDQMREVLDIGYLEFKQHQWFVQKIFEYKDKYSVHPSLEIMKTIIMSELDGEPEVLQDKVRDFFSKTHVEDTIEDVEDAEFVKDKSLDFCKKQKLYVAMEKSVELLDKCSFDEINTIISDAIKLGTDNDYGYDYVKDFEERFVIKHRDPITTGWPLIDSITRGGLGNGELGVVIAATGGGKSLALSHLGSQAIKAGYNVVHYTLELNDRYVALRYDSCITGVDLNELYVCKEQIYETVKDIKGSLIVKEYPTKSASTNTIKQHLEKIKKQKKSIDMIIVDYADLLKPTTSYKEKRIELESIYEELRGIAQEYDAKIWTACFHGKTKIYSPIGNYKIKDLVGKSGFPVYSYDHKEKKLVLKTVKHVYKSGTNQELWKVTLDNGKEIIVTPTHNFMLRNGEYRKVKDLVVGDSLMPLKRKMKDGRKKIYLNNGKWEHQYKLVAEWKYGDILKYHQVHHKDFNKYNDHPDNLEVLTISEHYKIHGKNSWVDGNPCGIYHLREAYSERMKKNNPMFSKKVRDKAALSRRNKCCGGENPMCSYEMREWFKKNNPQFREEVREKTRNTVKELWAGRTQEEKQRITDKAAITRFGSTKKERIQKIIEILTKEEFKTQKEFLKRIEYIPLTITEKIQIYKNKNCKVAKIEFWGHDDVYNMEVEDLHNYGLEAGIIVKNSQTNRTGLNAEVITMESISEAFNKCFVADFIFSISRTIEDKGTNQGRIFVAKNRSGPDGYVYPIFMNPSNVKIKILPPTDETLAEVETKSTESKLKEKYKQLVGNKGKQDNGSSKK